MQTGHGQPLIVQYELLPRPFVHVLDQPCHSNCCSSSVWSEVLPRIDSWIKSQTRLENVANGLELVVATEYRKATSGESGETSE